MKLAFWRRGRGRHALGAAVTAIPALRTTMPPVAPAVAAPVAVVPVVAVPVVSAPIEVPAELPVTVAAPTVAAGPRIELGFRDGSRASLDPNSAQGRALEDLASVLTKRD